MVISTRRELNRMRTGNVLGLLLGLLVGVSVLGAFAGSGPIRQTVLSVIGLVALTAIAIGLVQLISLRGTSRAILFHQPDQMVIATNHLHDGYKLRFFRDLLSDSITAFTDEEREQWSALSKVGFHPVFKVRDARKPILLSMLFLLFDDVYVLDHTNRWDYFDCRNTSEPTYSKRGVGPFTDESVLPPAKRQPAT